MRRSFGFSASSIARAASIYSASKKCNERKELIDSQNGIEKAKEPEYKISEFDFNAETRMCHISFLATTKYRTIDRYITQNRVRHPIYSGWKTKQKTVKKTVKLNNETLENLQNNEDELISLFCYEIIGLINNADFVPSWFATACLQSEKSEKIEKCNDIYNSQINADAVLKVEEERKLKEKEHFELSINNILENSKHRVNELDKKIKKANDNKHLIVFSILTFGIYAWFHSKRYIAKLFAQKQEIELFVDNKTKGLLIIREDIEKGKSNIDATAQRIQDLKNRLSEEISDIELEYLQKLQSVEPLLTKSEYSLDSSFVMLKHFVGMSYEKIIGCYMIHNRENNKYYVGQSKDVVKRITREHFNGTKVRNIIFAEDYFNSSFENKEDIFEVKIIPCQTKDELDQAEMRLIEQYDAFNNGYNGTNGNK